VLGRERERGRAPMGGRRTVRVGRGHASDGGGVGRAHETHRHVGRAREGWASLSVTEGVGHGRAAVAVKDGTRGQSEPFLCDICIIAACGRPFSGARAALVRVRRAPSHLAQRRALNQCSSSLGMTRDWCARRPRVLLWWEGSPFGPPRTLEVVWWCTNERPEASRWKAETIKKSYIGPMSS
jgi:hypothetical protein